MRSLSRTRSRWDAVRCDAQPSKKGKQAKKKKKREGKVVQEGFREEGQEQGKRMNQECFAYLVICDIYFLDHFA